jgi:hypothetical protein
MNISQATKISLVSGILLNLASVIDDIYIPDAMHEEDEFDHLVSYIHEELEKHDTYSSLIALEKAEQMTLVHSVLVSWKAKSDLPVEAILDCGLLVGKEYRNGEFLLPLRHREDGLIDCIHITGSLEIQPSTVGEISHYYSIEYDDDDVELAFKRVEDYEDYLKSRLDLALTAKYRLP